VQLSSTVDATHIMTALLPFIDCKPDSDYTMEADGNKGTTFTRVPWDAAEN
jgi:hypothetical protein